ncbi:hypothetical protein DICA2_C14136 [Diutina catenulata]
MSDKDLVHHYKVLKQFLDVSDDTSARSKSNSTRAARAREKLLKLSAAQFRELSTDVYDELRRRIDESRGEPSYLLPKSSFHPKRNQARQKLASLPQSRFKDLVSDISYEIERRGLQHEKPDPEPVEPAKPDPEPVAEPEPEQPAPAQKSMGVSSKTVVPTKANLAWSSDEEDDDKPQRRPSQKSQRSIKESEVVSLRDQLSKMTHERETNISKMTELERELGAAKDQASRLGQQHNELMEAHNQLTDDHRQLADKHSQLGDDLRRLTAEHTQLRSAHDELQHTHESVAQKHADLVDQHSQRGLADQHQSAATAKLEAQLAEAQSQLQQSQAQLQQAQAELQRSVTRSGGSDALQSQYDELLATHTQLQSDYHAVSSRVLHQGSERETEELRKENAVLEKQIDKLQQRVAAHAQQRSMAAPAVAPAAYTDDIRQDMDIFLQKMASIENAHPGSLHTKSEVDFWQSKYEESRSDSFATFYAAAPPKSHLQSLVSGHGLVSIKLVADCHALIESFLVAMHSPTAADVDVLFDKVAKLAVLATEVAAQGENHQYNTSEHAQGVRAAVNFALTATRYYAVYPVLVPRAVVERAVSEVSFAVADLCAVAKLRQDTLNERLVAGVKTVESTVNSAFAGVKPLRIGKKEVRGSPTIPQAQKMGSPTIPQAQKGSPAIPQTQQMGSPTIPQTRQMGSPTIPTRQMGSPTIPHTQMGSPTHSGSNSPTMGPTPSHAPRAVPKSASTQFSAPASSIVSQTVPRSTSQPLIGTPGSAQSPVTKPLPLAPTPTQQYQQEFAPPMKRTTSQSSVESSSSAKSESKGFFSMFKRAVSGPQPEEAAPEAVSDDKRKSIVVRNIDEPPSRTMSIKNLEQANAMVARGVSLKTSPVREQSDEDAESEVEPLENSTFESADHVSTAHTSPHGNQVDEADETTTADKSLFSDVPKRASTYSHVSAENEPPILKKDESSDSDYEYEEDVREEMEAQAAEDAREQDARKAREAEAEAKAEAEAEAREKAQAEAREQKAREAREAREAEQAERDAEQARLMRKESAARKARLREEQAREERAREERAREEREQRARDVQAKEAARAARADAVAHAAASTTSPRLGRAAQEATRKLSQSSPRASPILKSAAATSSPKVQKRVQIDAATTSEEESEDESDESEDESEEEESEEESDEESDESDESEDEMDSARQRQEYRKSMAAATFNIDDFDIENPDNTLTQVLLYLEHHTDQVISTIQSLLSAIKKPDATRGELRQNSQAIAEVISQMTEATNTSMNQTRNASLKEHGSWVVRSLEDCETRMKVLCKPSADKTDADYADKNFKQRLAGISFDIAKCTKELVKTVEEASLKEDIENLNKRIHHESQINSDLR